ncbi:aladin [Fopius arisanus]|uniref:AAAS_0 protein n=1 Tax=Fopius arisanus TaxID=64838 RepID=A0A0C9RF90_9HYME|nr:PREDICTED: aladin [Fopius arisanus]
MLKVPSLYDFPPLSGDDRATGGFIGGELVFSERRNFLEETQPYFKFIRSCPEVNVTPEILATRESARTIGAADLFLSVEDSAFKKIASTWREKGVVEAVRIAAGEDPERVSRIVHWLAMRITKILDFIEKKTSSYEGLPSIGSGSVSDIAGTRDWTTALIRCLAWHPHCTRLALACRDDRIRIYSSEIQGVAVLRHSAQKSVCSMSWRPNAGRELAAACGSGVLVWSVELGAASNSLSHALFLRQRNHAPVTSVNWHPQGDLLVSCSPNDFNMIVWDVAKEVGVPLRRVGGGGLCFSKWSICGSKLLAATCGNVFRVWNTGAGNPWSVERWTVPNGRVAAACFGPHQILLFASTEDPPTLFSLPLQDNIFNVQGDSPANDPKAAVPLIDLTKVSFDDDGAGVTVGGRVVATEWDPSGQYLAILFQDSPVVAVFKTEIGTLFGLTEVTPSCLVKGFPGESPNCLQFQQNINTNGLIACLTIAWSSGRVQQFPIVGGNKSATPTRTPPPLDRSISSSDYNHYTFL